MGSDFAWGLKSPAQYYMLPVYDNITENNTRYLFVARDPRDLANGPGKLCAALGITGAMDGAALDAGPVRLGPGAAYADADVVVTPRIGITRAAEWPLRYLVRDSPFVSRTPTGFYRRPYRPGADDV